MLTALSGVVDRHVSGGQLGGQWRCVSEAKAYRFEFRD
jgi:hypothetical protein